MDRVWPEMHQTGSSTRTQISLLRTHVAVIFATQGTHILTQKQGRVSKDCWYPFT